MFGILYSLFPVSCDFSGAGSTPALSGRSASEKHGTYPGIPDAVVNAPESDEQIFFDDGVKEVHLDIPVGSWSAEVVTPINSRDYRWDAKPDKTVFYVKFADGHIEKIGGGEKRFKDVKIRRGIMRIYGTVAGQKAIITIE